jgi:hypothetical protein
MHGDAVCGCLSILRRNALAPLMSRPAPVEMRQGQFQLAGFMQCLASGTDGLAYRTRRTATFDHPNRRLMAGQQGIHPVCRLR